MLSERRVVHMTRMAIYEKEKAKEMQPAIQYAKKDFVSTRTFQSVLLGTFLYALAFGGIAVWLFYAYLDDFGMTELLIYIIAGLVLYVLFLFFRIRSSRRHARRDYEKSEADLAEFKRGIGILLKIYDAEERSRSPRRLKESLLQEM